LEDNVTDEERSSLEPRGMFIKNYNRDMDKFLESDKSSESVQSTVTSSAATLVIRHVVGR
jgi:hypothetical protein